jgi:hypothetical protein
MPAKTGDAHSQERAMPANQPPLVGAGHAREPAARAMRSCSRSNRYASCIAFR